MTWSLCDRQYGQNDQRYRNHSLLALADGNETAAHVDDTAPGYCRASTIRLHLVSAGRHIELVDRPTKLQPRCSPAVVSIPPRESQNLDYWFGVPRLAREHAHER